MTDSQQKKLFAELAELKRAVSTLTQIWQEQQLTMQHQAETITELQIQCRFLMGAMKVIRPGSNTKLVGANGAPRLDIVDGWTIYTQYNGRGKMLEILQQEYEHHNRVMRATLLKNDGDPRELSEIIHAIISEDAENQQRADAEAGSEGREGNRGQDLEPSSSSARNVH